MITHDVVCAENGWAHVVNGVQVATFPSLDLAVNAARDDAEREAREGQETTLRYQGSDGKLHPMQLTEPTSASDKVQLQSVTD